jgi:hypothetical protein
MSDRADATSQKSADQSKVPDPLIEILKGQQDLMKQLVPKESVRYNMKVPVLTEYPKGTDQHLLDTEDYIL